MPASPTSGRPTRFLSARRLVLLASVVALGGAALFVSPAIVPQNVPGLTRAYAAEPPHPVSFADIVERVKPAVISVRVKVDGNRPPQQRMQYNEDDDQPNSGPKAGPNDDPRSTPGSPLERFFRRFGPDAPNGQRGPAPNDRNGQNERPPNQRPPRDFSMAQGSGFFISADGYAVTNNHVVDKARSVEVTTDDGKTYTAKVIGVDAKTDIALLKVDGRTDFPFVTFSDTQPRVGDWVIAVGNPFGLGGTVTAGIVSARGRDIGAGPYDDFIQIDAPVNKGNSGGPTFDVSGKVIGVNTAIFSPTGGSVGIGFAIPAETVKNVVAQLKEKGTVSRGWIGVQIQPVTAEIAESLGLKTTDGALVAETQPNSPALAAGILSGDVILSVNDQPIKDARDLAKRIAAIAPGSNVKLVIVRKGDQKTLSFTLAEYPTDAALARAPSDRRDVPNSNAQVPNLGLTLAPGRSGEGVVITAVDPDGPAAERGFKAGDIILDIGGKAVTTPADVRKILADARAAGKKTVLIRVKSGQATKFVALPIDRA